MTQGINQTLEAILAELEAESDDLGSQISALRSKFEANQNLIHAIKGKLGIPISCGSQSLIPLQAAADPDKLQHVASGDYGWLSTEIKNYIQKLNGAEFFPNVMMVDILQRNPNKRIARTAIYPILRRLAADGIITQTQIGSGKRPSKYKANELPNSPRTENQPEGTF